MEIQFIIANKDSWNLAFILDSQQFRKKKKKSWPKAKRKSIKRFCAKLLRE